ncbi:SDR family NAD(P)-dependent oxidoreductase [Mycobacterium sp. URHB0044]|jgi:NAD(P)-dependent dehydrogenase (short-subunit alcohol dehydrogenase family)|uniref:SDR family NAD(P)-dependent oxidoreductase n=1 Tax=Mycobacterium sp. URHB0044 TaxID=1380386 RepID=UPI00055B30C3|nr:SDR family NAD(P)-dependent oxidoreductase [Mycobacterium sp. URHB0044]
MTFAVAGRTIAITGATGGLGVALATKLRERKANVALLDLDGGAAERLAHDLGGGRVAWGTSVDVCSLESVEQAMAGTSKHFGRIDVVIAGAGIGNIWGTLTSTAEESWEKVIDVNLTGVWRTFRAALPYVADTGGQLTAIASMASFVHSPLHGSYAASKAAVLALCNSLRIELRESGVSVTSVHPAFFKTPMIAEALEDPVTRAIWGDFRGPFKPIPIDSVVAGIIGGIEHRKDQVVIPGAFLPIAKATGPLRPIMDRATFRRRDIRRAIDHYPPIQAAI